MSCEARTDGVAADGATVEMAADEVIRLDAVSKVFRMYGKPHQRFIHGLLRARADGWYGRFQALDGISVVIRRGETVGIVGRNGSGKSTLLQVICGILQPTQGTVSVNGRVAALLELGAGFNPDFTGRENIYLNAAVLGLNRHEVDARFDAIVAFADIGDFIEQPVKTYSSGMYIRLAFAVAINTDPQILIIDEALSVGDEAFQRKCFARIEELKRSGCTILFVSHSAGSVVQLCDRAILLDAGELVFSGQPKATVALYQKLLYASPDRRKQMRRQFRSMGEESLVEDPQQVGAAAEHQAVIAAYDQSDAERYDPGLRSESTVEYESRGARISDPHLVNADGERVNVLVPGRPYRYRYRVKFDSDARLVHFGMMIKSVAGVELFGMASHAFGDAIDSVRAGDVYLVEFNFDSKLLPGTYFMNAGVNGCAQGVDGSFLHRMLDVLMFKVEHRANDRVKVGFYDLASEPASSFRIIGTNE
ncbi:ABC transporter ATP-binding protein [Novilysobacter antarcticus]|uniref:ABC transporter ATP-binding protein n=1 Tax=Novilysobacter antarcticus TaxID=2862543 RepID=UPI001FE5F101|nr:ABC transporter ATP-binding protein [Lysobacter antarcticus]